MRIDMGYIGAVIFLGFLGATAVLLIAIGVAGMWRIGWC